jgi:hypothetical protein
MQEQNNKNDDNLIINKDFLQTFNNVSSSVISFPVESKAWLQNFG